MCLGGKLEKGERERIYLKTAQKLFLLPNEGSRGFYSEKVTLQQFWPYPGSTLDAYLNALLDLNWDNLGVLGKL